MKKIGTFEVYDFDEVKPRGFLLSKPHLLLGNGFGASLLKDVFSYSAIRQSLSPNAFTIGSDIHNIFNHIGSDDFEEAIRRLLASAPIAKQYGLPIQNMTDDSDTLKKQLISAIISNHPAHPWDRVNDSNYKNCESFLEKFKSIYTLNYDLLLYWTINRTNLKNIFNDGFKRVAKGFPLVWKGENQTLFHLHGGLHIFKIHWSEDTYEPFDRISEFDYIKIDNVEKNSRLISQIEKNLNRKLYPVTVAEGDHISKKSRIFNENFLRHSYLNFRRMSGDLFTFGVGLDKNQDDHLISALGYSSLRTIFVGVYNPNHKMLNDIDTKLRQVNYDRTLKKLKDIKVKFYNTASFSIW